MENGSRLSVTQAVRDALQVGLYRINGMAFPVRLLDARKVWGRTDFLISPVGGHGEKWVEASSITVRE